jgi:hypothetical protein
VRFADLDLVESGGLECRAELGRGGSACDAAGSGGYVGAGRVVHVGVRDHVPLRAGPFRAAGRSAAGCAFDACRNLSGHQVVSILQLALG